jgi:hypothetical protein
MNTNIAICGGGWRIYYLIRVNSGLIIQGSHEDHKGHRVYHWLLIYISVFFVNFARNIYGNSCIFVVIHG